MVALEREGCLIIPSYQARPDWCLRVEKVVPVTGLVYIQTTDLTLMDYLGISAGGS